MGFKSGFVAVVGKPNVGKSTLINTLIGHKVSIVSPKAQTTRDKIMGVMNGKDYQVVFIDTPGIHAVKNSLDKYMQCNIDTATKDVDLLLYLLDGTRNFDEEDLKRLKAYCTQGYPVYAVVTKIDLTDMAELFARIEVLGKIEGVSEVFCISAVKQKNLEALKEGILRVLKDDVKYFPDGEGSDKPLSFVLAEVIREKILWLLNDEVPHGVGVVIQKTEDTGDIFNVDATIYCERAGHKNIIIGKQGAMIREIGRNSRVAMEKILGKKVFLDMWVKVKEGWRDRDGALKDMGYRIEK